MKGSRRTERSTRRDGVAGDAAAPELSFLPLTAENTAETPDAPYLPPAEALLPSAAG